MELFVTLLYDFQSLTNVTKNYILDTVVVLVYKNIVLKQWSRMYYKLNEKITDPAPKRRLG